MAADPDEDDASSWVSELETALKEDEDECVEGSSQTNITTDKQVAEAMRATFWKVCLNVGEKRNDVSFDEIYDLPEQAILREDCRRLVDKLGNEDEDKISVVSDLESVLTLFCKQMQQKYESDNGWLEVLGPLVALKLPRRDLYDCFNAVVTNYVPRDCSRNKELFHVFRLLILYHDPELCSYLDTKKITPDKYCISWYRSLFSAVCALPVVHRMWDIYLQQEDPFLVLFLGLVILMNSKEQLLSFTDDETQNIVDLLATAPAALEANDVDDFCSLARFYSARTPKSFRRIYYGSLFGDSEPGDINFLHSSLCLSVSISEILNSSPSEQDQNESVRFFVVDCRPAEQYNCGHMSTAFHLDASLMLQEPAAFSLAVDALFATQKHALEADSAAAGEHLCFLGSGREEEDQYVHMVVASFLQKHTQYVSMANEGYIVLHDMLKDSLSFSLMDHSSRGCIVCNSEVDGQSSDATESDDFSRKDSFLGRISSAVKTKTAELSDKLVEYIQNAQSFPPEERHVSSKDKLGKRYRNMAPVFTIDDDPEDVKKNDNSQDIVSIGTWLTKPDTVASYKCHQIADNCDIHPSLLVIMGTHLYLLRELPDKQGMASIVARRSLTSIMKITSKRRHPELITFKYGIPVGESFQITDSDKLIIPEAGDATKLVKQQIFKIFE